jgi:hypothetical protein
MNEQQAIEILKRNGISASDNALIQDYTDKIWINKLDSFGKHILMLEGPYDLEDLDAISWWIRNKGIPEIPSCRSN